MFNDLTASQKAQVKDTVFRLIESIAADVLDYPKAFSSTPIRGAIGKNVKTKIDFEPDSNARIAMLAITERILERLALTFEESEDDTN